MPKQPKCWSFPNTVYNIVYFLEVHKKMLSNSFFCYFLMQPTLKNFNIYPALDIIEQKDILLRDLTENTETSMKKYINLMHSWIHNS